MQEARGRRNTDVGGLGAPLSHDDSGLHGRGRGDVGGPVGVSFYAYLVLERGARRALLLASGTVRRYDRDVS